MPDRKTESIIEENREYWMGRAAGYSDVNKTELATGQREKWRRWISAGITEHFPEKQPEEIKVLEVGTGPGFFAIILTECGFSVTAIDLTPAMLEEAKQNAGVLADRIHFLEMNAEDLSFDDASFDVVLSRNLTWNLPHPEQAYREWCRVLAPGGLLMNFDANWYGYLIDENARAGFEKDRENTARQGIRDENIGENFDVMEAIALKMPLTRILRPAWDIELLRQIGIDAEADEEVWKILWSDEEKINFSSTPMFAVTGVKRG